MNGSVFKYFNMSAFKRQYYFIHGFHSKFSFDPLMNLPQRILNQVTENSEEIPSLLFGMMKIVKKKKSSDGSAGEYIRIH